MLTFIRKTLVSPLQFPSKFEFQSGNGSTRGLDAFSDEFGTTLTSVAGTPGFNRGREINTELSDPASKEEKIYYNFYFINKLIKKIEIKNNYRFVHVV